MAVVLLPTGCEDTVSHVRMQENCRCELLSVVSVHDIILYMFCWSGTPFPQAKIKRGRFVCCCGLTVGLRSNACKSIRFVLLYRVIYSVLKPGAARSLQTMCSGPVLTVIRADQHISLLNVWSLGS